ncbi:head decoration protein [Klebsiella quasipneumoniae]|uniref:head decoration protein n=1 Tax=Klebsiella quasipneumoniae TaxID=1463165 RepID=UPI00352BA407
MLHYNQIFAGSAEVSSCQTVLTGGIIPAFTPLMIDPTTGVSLPWDGVNPQQAVFLTPCEIDATTTKTVQVYRSGIFNIDVVNWPESVTMLTQKLSAFAGSGIAVQPLAG